MTSYGHVTSSMTLVHVNLFYRIVSYEPTPSVSIGSLLDSNPLNCLLSEIFSIKVADKHTDTQTDT